MKSSVIILFLILSLINISCKDWTNQKDKEKQEVIQKETIDESIQIPRKEDEKKQTPLNVKGDWIPTNGEDTKYSITLKYLEKDTEVIVSKYMTNYTHQLVYTAHGRVRNRTLVFKSWNLSGELEYDGEKVSLSGIIKENGIEKVIEFR